MELMVVGVSKVPSAPLQNRKCVPRKYDDLTFKEDFRRIEKRNYLLKLCIHREEGDLTMVCSAQGSPSRGHSSKQY